MEDNDLTKWTDAVGSVGGTVGGILGALGGKNKSSAPAPAPTSKSPWLFIGGLALAAIVIVVAIFAANRH